MIHISNSNLAFTVLKKLVDKNLRNSIFPISGEFTEEEIMCIDKLTLTESDDLSEISKLANLQTLIITSSGISEQQLTENSYDQISLLLSLENLSIINVRNIEALDLEKLQNLKKVKLINNENLKKLKGLSKLKKLEQVIICGNDISKIENPIEYIDNTSEAKINIFDVNMYAATFGQDLRVKKYVEDRVNSRWSNIKFGEMLKFNNECFVFEFCEFMKMYECAKKILDRLDFRLDSDKKKALKIYEYIVNNVVYDYDALDYRDYIYATQEHLLKENKYLRQRVLLVNTSFAALINKRAVCDGYMNMMKFLLNLCDIESKKVMCSITTNSPWKTDHVILKFKDKSTERWFYSDPEKQQRQEDRKFFGLTLEEISKTHVFPVGTKESVVVKTKRK